MALVYAPSSSQPWAHGVHTQPGGKAHARGPKQGPHSHPWCSTAVTALGLALSPNPLLAVWATLGRSLEPS